MTFYRKEKTLFGIFVSLFFLWKGYLFFFSNDQKSANDRCPRIGVKSVMINPFLHLTTSSTTICKHLYEPLVEIDYKGRIIPKACERFEFDQEKKTYTFYLRDAYWSDGQKVTAYDFERSWKRSLEKKELGLSCHMSYYMKPIQGASDFPENKTWDEVGIHVENEKTILITLENNSPFFLYRLSFPLFSPLHPDWKDGLGPTNGPFCVDEWKFEHSVKLKKNPFYWDAQSIQIPSIEFQALQDNLGLLFLEKKELDFCELPENVPFSIDELGDSNRLYILNETYRIRMICINATHPLLRNKKIRKALSLSLDREKLVEVIAKYGQPAYTMVPSQISSTKERFVEPMEENTRLAQKLLQEGLKEVGLKRSDFSEIYFFFPTKTPKEIPEFLQQRWNEVLGIVISLQGKDVYTSLEQMCLGRPGLYAFSWCPDFMHTMDFLEIFGENGTLPLHWTSEEFNHLLNQAKEATNEDETDDLLSEAERILLSDFSVIPLYRPPALFAVNRSLRNFQINSVHIMDFSRCYWDAKEN